MIPLQKKERFPSKCIPNHARIEGKKNRKRTKREAMGKRLPPTNFIRGQRRKAKNVEPVGSIQRNSLSHSSPHSDSFSSSSLSLRSRSSNGRRERRKGTYRNRLAAGQRQRERCSNTGCRRPGKWKPWINGGQKERKKLSLTVQRRVMREMRGEEARGGGCGGCCRGRGCTLMPSAPNGGMEPGRNAGDPTQTGKSADVSRRRPHRRWAAPLLVVTTTTTMMMVMVLQVLHVDQTVLVLLLDVLGFRTPGPALVRAASRRLRAKLRMIVARERRHFGGRGTGYHFRRGPALRLHHVVQRSRARGLARPVNLLDFRKSGQRPRVHQGGSWGVARVLIARSVLLDGGRRGQVSRSVFGRWILLWRSGIRDRRQLIVSDGGVRGEGGRSRRDGGRVRLFSVRQQRSDGEAQSVHRFRDRLGRLGLVGTWAARWRRHRGGHP